MKLLVFLFYFLFFVWKPATTIWPVFILLTGIRLHFHSLVKGLTAQAASKAQLGLGHSYSRAKVKFNVNRADNMIIQSIALLDQLDKDINTFSMRVRWVCGKSISFVALSILLMLTTDRAPLRAVCIETGGTWTSPNTRAVLANIR